MTAPSRQRTWDPARRADVVGMGVAHFHAAGARDVGVSPASTSRALPVAVTLLIAGTALLFGAVHPWAYWPAGIAVVLTGMWILRRTGLLYAGLNAGMPAVLILLPVLLQVIAIPRRPLDLLAPSNTAAIASLELGFAAGGGHSVSVAPALTLAALGFLLVGTFWVGALSRGLGRVFRASHLVPLLIGAAVAISLFALVQKATFNGKIYWFWESPFGVSKNYYGPFVNRNHFAGWMLLATSLGAGYLLGLLAVAGRSVKAGWRDRILWLGTPQASFVTLTAVCLIVMATSLVWSVSRSGIAGAAAAFAVLAIACLRRIRSRTRARVAVVGLLLMLACVGAWRGLDTLASSYSDTRTLAWRIALWRDSLPPLRAFVRFGSGLNTYGQVMLLYPQTDTGVHARQAHNDYLQLAIEGGLLVAVPWLLAIGILLRRIARALALPQDDQTWWIRMGAVAGICGLALQEVTEFSLQIPAVALLFATALAIALHEPAVSNRPPGARRTLDVQFSRRRAAGTRGPVALTPGEAV